MAAVKVTVTNKNAKAGPGFTNQVGLLLDDEQDAERIAYLKKQLKADVYDDVKVEPLEKQKTDKPLEKRTVDELRQYAADNNVDLGEATKKEDILAAIAAASQQN